MPKDACYRKVKAKFKVFPSAYAGGAIAKCRKVGAATKNKNIARGCGIVMSNRRKVTKYR